jgi:hypothetical protein
MAQTAEERRAGKRKWVAEHREQKREYDTAYTAAHKRRELYPGEAKELSRLPQRKAYVKQLKQQRRELIQSFLIGCAVCGETDQAQLLFHHTDASTKLFEVQHDLTRSEESIRAEIAKCVVWCRSCHGKFHNTLHCNG